MISKNLNVAKSINGVPFWAIPFSPVSYEVRLVADTEQTLVVPDDVDVAVFSYSTGSSVKVQEGGASITLPGLSFTPTTSCMMPSSRYVEPGQTLRFISPTPDIVNVSFYKNNQD